MPTLTENQIDTYLDRVAGRVQRLRQRNLFTDAERQHAQAEIQKLQGALAMCQALLRRIEPPRLSLHRHAA